ncbi:hypothetical protein HK102_000721 [Quaeritorhiza haematococci]|nr:hypothetical protein HK102_000721 [Quaeritorhiza haematococci]
MFRGTEAPMDFERTVVETTGGVGVDNRHLLRGSSLSLSQSTSLSSPQTPWLSAAARIASSSSTRSYPLASNDSSPLATSTNRHPFGPRSPTTPAQATSFKTAAGDLLSLTGNPESMFRFGASSSPNSSRSSGWNKPQKDLKAMTSSFSLLSSRLSAASIGRPSSSDEPTRDRDGTQEEHDQVSVEELARTGHRSPRAGGLISRYARNLGFQRRRGFHQSEMTAGDFEMRTLQGTRKRRKTDDFWDSDEDEDLYDEPSHFSRRKSDPRTSDPPTGIHPKHFVLPYVITGYMQLFFSLFIVGVMLYFIVQFILTVHHDLEMKADEYSAEISYQIAECRKHYYINRCEPETRIPAVAHMCKEWEICMSRDPKEVGRLKVGAETLAEILNKLIDPLSYKTMIFGSILLFGSLFLTTTAVQLIRGRSHSGSDLATAVTAATAAGSSSSTSRSDTDSTCATTAAAAAAAAATAAALHHHQQQVAAAWGYRNGRGGGQWGWGASPMMPRAALAAGPSGLDKQDRRKGLKSMFGIRDVDMMDMETTPLIEYSGGEKKEADDESGHSGNEEMMEQDR